MTKFSLIPPPTFKSKVLIPVAGCESMPVEMVFKHRGRIELAEFIERAKVSPDHDSFMLMVEGWELEDDLNPANVKVLLDNHLGAWSETFDVYIGALTGRRLGSKW